MLWLSLRAQRSNLVGQCAPRSRLLRRSAPRNDRASMDPYHPDLVLFLLVGLQYGGDALGVGGQRRDAGALLLQQHADRAVALAPAAVHRLGQLFEGEIGETHRHADLAAETD